MSVFLTPTERRIAEQAAQGARNDEIARAVGLSHRTVEWHLSRIYRKLAVRSRTELAARFSEATSTRITLPFSDEGLAHPHEGQPAAADGQSGGFSPISTRPLRS